MKPARLRTSLLVALLSSGPALAQESQPPPKDKSQSKDPPRYKEFVEVEAELPTIPVFNNTALKSALAVQSTPASVAVVPRAVFQSQQGRVLADALRNVSGVNVGTGFGVFDFFVIRGFDSLSSGLVLTDAAFEPESTFYPLYNVRQVEVLKGPAAFLYGGNPLSGAVNLIRKQPQARDFADVSLSYGSFRTFDGSLDANLSRADGSLAFRMNALYQDSQSYRDDKDGSILGLNPSISWRPDPDTRLTLNLEYLRSEHQPDSGLPVVGKEVAPVPRTRSYQSPFDASRQHVYRARFDLERRVGDRLTLRDKLYYTDLDWRSDGTLLAGVLPNRQGGLDVARTLLLLDDRQRLVGNQAEAVLSFSTGSVSHSLLAGLELSRLGDEFTLDVALLPNIGLLDPMETARRPFFILPGLSSAGDTRSQVLAPYVVERASISDKLQLFIGGRLDVIDYEDKASATKRDETRLSPMAGVLYSPLPDLSLYANAGTAFAPPSSLVMGERKPEESRQIEIGAKKQLGGGKGFASLALYHLEKDNIAIPDDSGATRQTGDQRSRGLEAEVSAEIQKDCFAFLTYAWSDAELTRFAERAVVGIDPRTFAPVFATLDRSGNTPAFAPRHILNLWTMKQFRSGLAAGAGARYVSGQFIAEDNAFEIDSYLTLEAMASYKKGRWKWSLNLKNLTNREYETRGFGSSAAIPANLFAVYGRVELLLGTRH